MSRALLPGPIPAHRVHSNTTQRRRVSSAPSGVVLAKHPFNVFPITLLILLIPLLVQTHSPPPFQASFLAYGV
jgi:hypothetical protein